ncbi:hypothetical protein EOD41_05985 [Mucilaginibacter limnophilus]|uniref:Uncharacterized protein n=1 Tax=Mucilaginibacter limnophilus TaxID=1932778 RepID=A0A3S2Y428_9SPHI|nr:hypothetical protein [Mucilaginibacter limnophilus]RVU01514.1 hypothetical protein EOD41_05985 [Mucilaginibacter limnophilus]
MTDQPTEPNNVLVFKTSILTEADRHNVTCVLDEHESIEQWHVDLDDCDKVLRVVTNGLSAPYIIELVNQKGYLCVELL